MMNSFLANRFGKKTATLILFLFSGGVGFLIYYITSNVVHYGFGLTEPLAATVGTITAVVPTFLLQRTFTFRHAGKPLRAFLKYSALQLINVAITVGISAIGASLQVPAIYGFLIAGFSGTLVSFFIQRSLVFGQST